MPWLKGVHLLPSTGEFTYDTIAHTGAKAAGAPSPLNTFYAPNGAKTDYSIAIDQLQAAHPECMTVSLVVSWFGNSIDAATCAIYPSTTFPAGAFQQLSSGAYVADNWRVSSLNQNSSGLIPLPTLNGAAVYGGTPSDQSVVRCIQDLKSRGFRVVFYPFVLMTAAGYPWRGLITTAPDLTAAATTAINGFLGSATIGQFTPDPVNLTVAYSGSAADYTYRRMILHYAWLCALAGGVSLFLIGSELRGLETVRGPAWTRAGGVDGNGKAIWDYPFVAGLQALSDDVRAIFDGQSLTKNLITNENLIAYSADWSTWMGYQHPGESGQWPHLDQLWAHANVDVVGFDNYLSLSDWTTGASGLDVANWASPAPIGPWPPGPAQMNGLGLSGAPTIHSRAYLKGNIEGGEKFNWFYADGNNLGPGFDPNGSDLIVSLPEGDRLAQARSPYYSNQQALANKQLRWWWNNAHTAIYDAGDGLGWAPHGPQTEWKLQSKSIAFIEYGVPACDKGTNQPNVFFDAKSIESATPYWSIWNPLPGGGFAPQRDDTLASLALQSIYEYWNVDGHNATSVSGVPMVQFAFCCAWNWDARPFPTFPLLAAQWGDAGNWQSGDWLNGRGPSLPPLATAPPPIPGSYLNFPTLATLSWSTTIRPSFGTEVATHIAGRETRKAHATAASYDIELTYEALRADSLGELQTLMGFFNQCFGAAASFWFALPGLSNALSQPLGVGDGATTNFPLVRSMAGYSEAVQAVSGVGAVYLSGALQLSGWSASPGFAPSIVFQTPPPNRTVVTADYGQLWLCRFVDDIADLENFMSLLWSFRTVKLRTVRP